MITNIKNISGVTHLTWIINNICTKSCDYCPTNLHRGKNHHYDWTHAKSFIKEIFKRYEKLHVTISGGEPTVSPFLIDVVKEFYNNGHTIGITSNAARTKDYYKELCPMLSYIGLSWHPSDPDPEFIEKALTASDHCFTLVRVMMDARHWDECISFLDRLKQIKELAWEPVMITPWHTEERGIAPCAYTEEQLEWFKTAPFKRADEFFKSKRYPLLSKQPLVSFAYNEKGKRIKNFYPNELINKRQNVFTGWTCYPGLESLFVQYTGQISSANCGQNRNLGTIQDIDNIKWITDPVTCTQPSCECTSDILLTKYRYAPIVTTKQKFLNWIKKL
jgi:organic radical activating enzyme